MNKNVQKRIREFVEQERQSPVDEELLTLLRSYLAQDTLYWGLPPEKRNAFNAFLRELNNEFTREMISGEYGAQIVLESLLVTAFEVGIRLGGYGYNLNCEK